MSPRVIPRTQSPEQRREELEAAVARFDEAAKLRPTLEGLRRDIARMEAKRDRLAAIGDDRIEIERRSYDQRFGIEIRWEPVRSALTGTQLAADVELSTEALRSELARTEKQIAELLR